MQPQCSQYVTRPQGGSVGVWLLVGVRQMGIRILCLCETWGMFNNPRYIDFQEVKDFGVDSVFKETREDFINMGVGRFITTFPPCLVSPSPCAGSAVKALSD